MKIAILSRNRALYSTRRLLEAAHARGHDVSVVDTMSIPVEVGIGLATPPQPAAFIARRERNTLQRVAATELPQVDAIIPRIGASITFYGLAVVRQFEARGVITTATSAAIANSRDKLHSLQLMDSAGLPTPRTTIVADSRGLFPAVRAVGGPPVIIKLIRGTQGRGVILARNLRTVAAVLKKVRQLKRRALVQEFIAEARGRDIRVIVVGEQCVAAMERRAVPGDFRANLHRGGSAVPFPLDSSLQRLAVAAARAHGLDVAGVDLLQANRGPLLLEVNSSPGLQGIEQATEVDVAGAIVRHLEQAAALKGVPAPFGNRQNQLRSATQAAIRPLRSRLGQEG